MGAGFDFGVGSVYVDVVSLVWSYVDVPVDGCLVVVCGDLFSGFAHEDDAGGGHSGGVFAVCDVVVAFVVVAVLGPFAEFDDFFGGEVHGWVAVV